MFRFQPSKMKAAQPKQKLRVSLVQPLLEGNSLLGNNYELGNIDMKFET